MPQVTYARLVDGVIAEYPVYPVHIETRGHPLSWYTLVKFAAQPEVPAFHYAREVPEVMDDTVRVTYVIESMPLESLMAMLPQEAVEGMPVVENPPPTPELTARIQQLTIARVQKRLDDFAATRAYDGILSAATYATSADAKFKAEGQYAVSIREATWKALYGFMAGVVAGTTPLPTKFETIEAALPELAWPV